MDCLKFNRFVCQILFMLICERCSGKWQGISKNNQTIYLFIFSCSMRPRNTHYLMSLMIILHFIWLVRCNFLDQIMQNHPEERLGDGDGAGKCFEPGQVTKA
jgi:hypothetical protein